MTSALKSVARRSVVNALDVGGFSRLFHRKLLPNHFTILMYHGIVAEPLAVEHSCFVDQGEFERQVAYLKRNCQLLSLERAVKLARDNQIDRPSVVITFDDGFQNNFDVAFPILRELHAPATIFLTTGYIGTNDTLWYCRLHRAIEMTDRSSFEWRDIEVSLNSPRARSQASRLLSQQLKKYPHPQLQEELARVLVALDSDPREPMPKESPFRMLNRDAIQVMSDSDVITFGGHTDSHVILSGVNTVTKQDEIARSLTKVTEWTGRECRLFAYPNGQRQDFDQESMSILRAHDVEAAVTTMAGGNTFETPGLELRRYGVGPGTDLKTFRLMVHHLLPYARKALRRVAGRRDRS